MFTSIKSQKQIPLQLELDVTSDNNGAMPSLGLAYIHPFVLLLTVFSLVFIQDALCQVDLRSLSDEQLIQVIEQEDINTIDYYKKNDFSKWSKEDLTRILGVIYLDAYLKGEDLGDKQDKVISTIEDGKRFSRIRPNEALSSTKRKNIEKLESIANTLFFWTNTCFDPKDDFTKKVYFNYGFVDSSKYMTLPKIRDVGFPEIKLEEFPTLDGSTSTKPLRIALAATLFELQCQWCSMLDGLSFPRVSLNPNAGRHRQWATVLINSKENGLIQNNQSVGCWIELTRAFDYPETPSTLVINALPPDLTRKYNPDWTVIHPEYYEWKIIGYDALVPLTNIGNPCESLTIEEIKSIYQGKITDWDKITNNKMKGRIVPIWRNASSGTGTLMAEMIFGKALAAPKNSSANETIMTMLGVIEMMRKPNTIGFSFHFYEQRIYPRIYVKELAINGVKASNKTIADGTYPLRAPIYAAIPKNAPPDSPTRKIYDFLSTEAGQLIVKASGYVPIDLKSTIPVSK